MNNINVNKIYRCPLDGRIFSSKAMLYSHIEKNYQKELDKLEFSPARYYFFLKYKKLEGKSVISGKPTKWNETVERYERFANEQEVEEYKKQFKARMMKKYGKASLLNDPKHQKKMLDSRSISAEYKWLDGHISRITGLYEKDFLEYIETIYGFNHEMVTEPPTIYYKMEDTTRFYLPDFFIPILNCIIEIKGSNNHYQKRDERIEILKEKAVLNEGFNYIQINNKIYTPFNIFFKKEVLDKI